MVESARESELIVLENVTKSFRDREALKPISFSIRSGEFVTLLGPSGSGKSTLLRLIAGLDTPTTGRVLVATKSRAFVFQDSALLPWRTVRENVALPLELARDSSGDVASALESVGLTPAADLFPNQLSGGMKMRASVARALVSKPSLLLLDEPFAALDERTRYKLQEDLRALWAKMKMTVVFVTHSVSEAVFVSDRALVLSEGPGRVLEDRRFDLGEQRRPHLRTETAYLREVTALTEAFS